MLHQESKKHWTLTMLLCLAMVFTMLTSTAFASNTANQTGSTANSGSTPSTGGTVKSVIWDEFPKIANISDGTIRGVDLSMYQTNLGWEKKFTNYQQKPVTNLISFFKSQGVNTVTVKVAASAVRKVSPDTKIALQLESPNCSKFKTIMDAWKKYDVDYDVLGASYYPFWANKSENKLSDLKAIQQLAKDYGKDFVVMETSWISNSEDADGTNNQVGAPSKLVNYKVGPQGQVDSKFRDSTTGIRTRNWRRSMETAGPQGQQKNILLSSRCSTMASRRPEPAHGITWASSISMDACSRA